LINLTTEDKKITKFCDTLYQKIQNINIEILFDDRDVSPGIKFKEADLIGIPIQIIVGQKNFKYKKVEFKIRKTGERIICNFEEIEKTLKEIIDKLIG